MHYIYDKVKGRNKRVLLKDASIKLLEKKIKKYQDRKSELMAYRGVTSLSKDKLDQYDDNIKDLKKEIERRRKKPPKLFLVNL